MMRIISVSFGLAILMSFLTQGSADTHLYPFGKKGGDTQFKEKRDISSVKLVTSDKFKIQNTADRRVYVNINGVVSLHAPFNSRYPTELPILSVAFAALFWADHDISREIDTLWYRLSHEKKDIRRAKNDVRDNFEGCNNNFKPKTVLVATWQDVHSYEYVLRYTKAIDSMRQRTSQTQERSPHESNTYQAVLATDGVDTFAILNYQKIMWISSEGNLAVVGFNAGDGINSYEHPLSGTTNLTALVTGTNTKTGEPGRWMYKLSGDMVLSPNCSQNYDG